MCFVVQSLSEVRRNICKELGEVRLELQLKFVCSEMRLTMRLG
jgi:hypothetical protein